jgi:serine/threonine protein phosphatase PrpC
MTGQPPAGQQDRCPSCGAPVTAGDHYCEACGAGLSAPPPAAAPAAGTPASCPHCQSAAISADGYCESCGRRAAAPRDHEETDLGQLAGVSDRGLHHHRNEDAMAVAAVQTDAGPVSVAVVCDGVSGSARGDEASRAAADAAAAVLVPAARAGEDPAVALQQAVRAAQDAVAALAAGDGGPRDAPSATYVSALITADAVSVCWLGDSRAYWLDTADPANALLLTADDSVAAELVAAGQLTEAEAAASPHAHVVTGWLGAELSRRAPHLARFVPPGAGTVLLCSDGLWNYEPGAADLAGRAAPGLPANPADAARRLTEFALTAGGVDNITVVVAPFPPAAPAPASGPGRTPTEPIQIPTLPIEMPAEPASGSPVE